MEPERSILDEIFGQSEEDLETFMEAISDQINPDAWEERGADQSDIERIRHSAATGESEPIEKPNLTEQIYGKVYMNHGWDGPDYVWHIATTHPKFHWKVNDRRLCYGIAKVMNVVIPNTCEVKIWLPYPNWEIEEYTFKALNLRSYWQVDDKAIENMNTELMKVLETMT